MPLSIVPVVASRPSVTVRSAFTAALIFGSCSASASAVSAMCTYSMSLATAPKNCHHAWAVLQATTWTAAPPSRAMTMLLRRPHHGFSATRAVSTFSFCSGLRFATRCFRRYALRSGISAARDWRSSVGAFWSLRSSTGNCLNASLWIRMAMSRPERVPIPPEMPMGAKNRFDPGLTLDGLSCDGFLTGGANAAST